MTIKHKDIDHTFPTVQKKEIFGWAMYDFANSSYTTVVITVIYSAFFVQHIVPASSTAKDSYWSLAIILSTLISLLLSPFVGILCDFSGRKKIYLMILTVICSITTALLFIVNPGEIMLGITLLVFSNAAFMLGENFCASFLPELASKDNMAKISGIGWGIGYMGGLASLILVLQIIPENGSNEIFIERNQWAMMAIGIFFFIAALPTFLLVRERSQPAPGFEVINWKKLFLVGVENLKSSMNIIRQYPLLFKFLCAFMIYMAGLESVVKFVGIYATLELKFAQSELVILFLILQFSAMGGALCFGFIQSKIGSKSTILLTLALWVTCILGIFFLDSLVLLLNNNHKNIFFVIALIAGIGIGSTQSSSRAIVGMLTPAHHSAQMFGFWGFFAKLAIILGMSFGIVSDVFDSRRIALLLVLVFFIVGALMLMRIPLDQGIAEKSSKN